MYICLKLSFNDFRLKVVRTSRLVSYSGDEYWSLARGLDSDKANNLDKDLLEGEMTCRWKPWLEEVDEATRHSVEVVRCDSQTSESRLSRVGSDL